MAKKHSDSNSPAEQQKKFFELTPDKILNAVEEFGVKTTGRVMQLPSMENRVYEVERDLNQTPENPSEGFVVVKFYRPGRWSKEQILEEHSFLRELAAQEIPVIAPLVNKNDQSLILSPETDLHVALFPKCGGRSPDELTEERAVRLGRLLARVHSIGAQKTAPHRIKLSHKTFAEENLAYLLETEAIPAELRAQFTTLVKSISQFCAPHFETAHSIRLHGDCHFGNIIERHEKFHLIDFDDMVMGPAVQDLWLLLPSHDDHGRKLFATILSAYQELRSFNFNEVYMIEGLRALRMIHYCTWIAKRKDDPYFQRTFPQFGTMQYWSSLLGDLNEQWGRICSGESWV